MRKAAKGGRWQVRQTTLEISLENIKKNYFSLLKKAGKAKALAVLKSNAYGHGDVSVARYLSNLPESARLYGFGVANVEEALHLRRARVKGKIMVLSGIQRYDAALHRCLRTCDLVPVISSLSVLREAARCVTRARDSIGVHLKLNTGMNRLGLDPKEIPEAIALLAKTPGLRLEGLLSHLLDAETPRSPYSARQAQSFRRQVRQFTDAGFTPTWIHLANSGGTRMNVFPDGNLVRLGLNLYGLGDKSLSPAARWTAQVYQVRELQKGETVGYGARFRAKKKIRMAVLGVGYADGYRRALSNKADVLIRGQRCRVLGSVSMDLTAVDVSKVKNLSRADKAVLIGKSGKASVSADDLADLADTISYEIMTGITERVPRVIA